MIGLQGVKFVSFGCMTSNRMGLMLLLMVSDSMVVVQSVLLHVVTGLRLALGLMCGEYHQNLYWKKIAVCVNPVVFEDLFVSGKFVDC